MSTDDGPVEATVDERLEMLELQLEVACSRMDDQLDELKKLRAEIQEALTDESTAD